MIIILIQTDLSLGGVISFIRKGLIQVLENVWFYFIRSIRFQVPIIPIDNILSEAPLNQPRVSFSDDVAEYRDFATDQEINNWRAAKVKRMSLIVLKFQVYASIKRFFNRLIWLTTSKILENLQKNGSSYIHTDQ